MASDDDVARIVLRFLCTSNCQASIKQLFVNLKQDGQRIEDYTSLLRFLDKYPKIFCIQNETRETRVYVQAPVPLCNKKGQCETLDCNSLHICKFFLLSECADTQCAYGHILKTGHNLNVLQPFLMDQLTDDEIRVILTNIRNQTFLTKPEICKFYNIAKGCNNPKCQFLHICTHFLHNTCKFGRRCKRSHNIADPDVTNILDRYGIDTERSENQIVADLKIIFDDKDSLEICLFKLKGKCWYRDRCFRHHKDTIYQWQYQLGKDQRWEDFDGNENLNIETNYCQPQEETCSVSMLGEDIEVSFDEPMTGIGRSIKMAVRRLSTLSSEAPNAQPAMIQWTTEWRWYWKGPVGEWILYGDKDPAGTKSSLYSETIETKYLENSKGAIDFGTSQFKYKLNFDTMMQENVKVSTQREVRRRPKFFKMEDLKKRAPDPQSNARKVPKEWSVQKFKTAKALLDHYDEIKVDLHSEEYKNVQGLFNKTVPGNKIRSIYRIENGALWYSFCQKKTQMTTKAGKPVKELSLFHGTEKASIEPICHQGFEFRYSGSRVGAKFGKGSYFARDSIYSTHYSKSDTTGRARMFMARVLVGDYVVGKSDYVRPPQTSANDPFELYDSCVDDIIDPSIHVIFSNEQTYPEYLIKYSTD